MSNQRVITGYFTEESKLFSAIKQIQSGGFTIVDVRTPFPVHGLDKLLKFEKTNLSIIAFVSGCIGMLLGFGIQYLVSTKLYPINFGGKPLLATPSFMPVTVMLTFLFAAFGVALGFMFQSKLGAGALSWIPDERTSDDRFLVILSNNRGEPDAYNILVEVGAEDVKSVEVTYK